MHNCRRVIVDRRFDARNSKDMYRWPDYYRVGSQVSSGTHS